MPDKKGRLSTIFSSLRALSTWKRALFIYYSAPQEQTFRKFRNGAIFFAVGLIIIYLASTTLEDSAKQELVVLFGLAITCVGFIAAMLAYIRIVIGRILVFINKK